MTRDKVTKFEDRVAEAEKCPVCLLYVQFTSQNIMRKIVHLSKVMDIGEKLGQGKTAEEILTIKKEE